MFECTHPEKEEARVRDNGGSLMARDSKERKEAVMDPMSFNEGKYLQPYAHPPYKAWKLRVQPGILSVVPTGRSTGDPRSIGCTVVIADTEVESENVAA